MRNAMLLYICSFSTGCGLHDQLSVVVIELKTIVAIENHWSLPGVKKVFDNIYIR